MKTKKTLMLVLCVLLMGTFISCSNEGEVSGHQWVNMGTGTKWATCNIGANSPAEIGSLFAWGETQAKSSVSTSNYKFYDASNSSHVSKYNSKDGLVTLEGADDAATQLWGKEWRMPTQAEIMELFSGCKKEVSSLNGVNGILLTADNGNTLFFPFGKSEYLDGEYLNKGVTNGSVWTSSLEIYEPYYAMKCMYYEEWGIGVSTTNEARFVAVAIRPVRK